MKYFAILLLTFGITIPNTTGIKTKIYLTVPGIEEVLEVDVELEEISVLGAVKGIPSKILEKWSQQPQDELYNWLSSKNDIQLIIIYGSDQLTTSGLTPTLATTKAGLIVSFGFEFTFTKLPYPEICLKTNNDPTGVDNFSTFKLGYFKENTSEIIFLFDENATSEWTKLEERLTNGTDFRLSRRGQYIEIVKNAVITTPLTKIPLLEKRFLIVAVDRIVKVGNDKSEIVFEYGEFNQRNNEIILQVNRTLYRDKKERVENVDLLSLQYCDFPTVAFSASIIQRTFGDCTKIESSILATAPLTIRRADVLSSEHVVMEGTIEPGTSRITVHGDRDAATVLAEHISKRNSTWHVTLSGARIKWVVNPRIISKPATRDGQRYTFIVEFDYVV